MYPALDGVVLDEDVRDLPCHALVGALKEIKPKIPIIAISGPGGKDCPGADYRLESFEPRVLLELLVALKPKETMEIEKREEELENEQ
jgi:hypothetical protein